MKTIKEILKERSKKKRELDGFYAHAWIAGVFATGIGACYKGSNPALRAAAMSAVGIGMLLNTAASFGIGESVENEEIVEIVDAIIDEE